MDLAGWLGYLVFFAVNAAIFGLMCLALNVQWGFAGLFNVGIAGFWAIGAYTSALLTASPGGAHAGLGWPIWLGVLAGGVVAGAAALIAGIPTLRLRGDYLAIATLGIAEIIRLVAKDWSGLTGGVHGLSGIPRPWGDALSGTGFNVAYLVILLVVLAVVYWVIERAIRSPWGRVLRAIRADEAVALAAGKDSFRYRLEALALGAVVIGIGGGLYAHFIGYISPDAFEPVTGTFIVWAMLIIGGSGNNRGALLGAFVVWGIWSATDLITGYLPAQYAAQVGSIRFMLIGLFLLVMLIRRPQGLLPEVQHVSRTVEQAGRRIVQGDAGKA
ncbi:MAG TPA: branched-chain amino acid ABC transporter permease [Limnochordia bacterium]|nr:branched-chain amino acid ABC transporter permease [Limnochordia bacterium]